MRSPRRSATRMRRADSAFTRSIRIAYAAAACWHNRRAFDATLMIGRLTGILLEKNPPQLTLDVQGVAYEVDVPMSTFYNLPGNGERVTLYTHLVVREDAH